MPSHWANMNGQPEADEEQKGTRKKWIPSKKKLRQWAMASTEGGVFRCPGCQTTMSCTYSRYGKMSTFQEPALWCKDCSDTDKFIKIQGRR